MAAKSTRASSGETRSSIDTNGTPIARAPPAGPHFVPHIQDSDYEKLLSRASSRTFRGHGSPLSFYVVSDRWKNATIDYIRVSLIGMSALLSIVLHAHIPLSVTVEEQRHYRKLSTSFFGDQTTSQITKKTLFST